MKEAQKKQAFVIVGVICLVVAIILVARFLKAKEREKASKEFVDFVQNGTTPQPMTGTPYPDVRDLSGFDQGDVLNYKGNRFTADVAGGKWVIIS